VYAENAKRDQLLREVPDKGESSCLIRRYRDCSKDDWPRTLEEMEEGKNNRNE